MTIPAVHCEAKKIAYRQTKDGLVVSFVIHPNDLPDSLAVAPLGQRYMLALAAIGDDEQAVPPIGKEVVPDTGSRHDNATPPSSEAGVSAASQRGKERYLSATPMGQALIRACRLSEDERFRTWAAPDEEDVMTVAAAAAYIREMCCRGGSRGLIGEDPECYQRFLALETEFRMFVGEMATPR